MRADIAAESKEQPSEVAGSDAGLSSLDQPWLIPEAEGLLLPASYRLGEDATTELAYSGKTRVPKVTPVAYAPVLITGRLRDEDEAREVLRIAYRRGGMWDSAEVDRGVAFEGRKLVELATTGFPVSGHTKEALSKYLTLFEAANLARLPCQHISRHLGWQSMSGHPAGFLWGNTYLPKPGERADQIIFRSTEPGERQLADAFASAGTLDAWKTIIARLQPYPRVLLTLYASFVPPLLPILDAPNFVVDLANSTSTGKTTAARVAASVWGNPNESAPKSVINSWDATRVFVERASGLISGLPLILDDTKRAKTPQAIGDVLYALANGRGRGRGTKTSVAATQTWHTVLISTGEAPATSYSQAGGTRMRTLTLRGRPFNTVDTDTAVFVSELNAALRSNYGHAGPILVQDLLGHAASEQLRSRYVTLCQHYTGAGAFTARLAAYLAAIHVAAEQVHRLFDFPWDPGKTLEALWSDLAAEAEDPVGARRALDGVWSWASANSDRFEERRDEMHPPPAEWAGRWPKDDTWEWIAVFPHVLDRILETSSYEPEAIKGEWRDRGWLDCDSDRRRFTKKMRTKSGNTHLVVIRRDALESRAQEWEPSGNISGNDTAPTEEENVEDVPTFPPFPLDHPKALTAISHASTEAMRDAA